MQTTPISIPPECTTLIIQYLWNDVSALQTLLFCSRECFSLVVPVLYRDPFRLIDRHPSWNRVKKSERTAKLMMLLYTCATTMPNQQDSEHELSTNSHLAKDIAKLYPIIDEVTEPPTIKPIQTPLAIDYLYYYTYQSQIPRAFRAFELINPVVKKYQQGSRYIRAIDQMSTNLLMALSGHFPGRIQVLSLTPAQIKEIWQIGIKKQNDLSGTVPESERPHNSAVKSLKMLRRLELDLRHTGTSGTDGVEREDLLQYPLLFIQEHQKIYHTRPKDLIKDPPGLYGWSSEHLDSDSGIALKARRDFNKTNGPLLQELVIRGGHNSWTPVDLLSRIAPLSLIDLSAWNADVPEMEHIPTSRLKSLRINIERRLSLVQVPIDFLKYHCKHLEEIRMTAQSEDTFHWAIDPERPVGQFVPQEKIRRRLKVLGSTNSTSNIHEITNSMASTGIDQQQENSQTPEQNTGPIQIPGLKVVELYGPPRELVFSLEDATDAFRDTLEQLSGYEDGYSRRSEYPRLSLSWYLPQLTRLDLRGRFVFFLDIGSLRFAPNLRVVKLTIESNITGGTESKDREYEAPDFSAFADMRLEEIQLRGASLMVDNSTLDILSGRRSSIETDVTEPSSRLTESLISFTANESHGFGRRGLIPFVKAMKKLQVIQLGIAYKYAAESLREAAGPRLYVDIDSLNNS